MALTISDIGKAVLDTHYAVRGPIVARAQELEKAGKEIIYCKYRQSAGKNAELLE
jgi:hypothetical protein